MKKMIFMIVLMLLSVSVSAQRMYLGGTAPGLVGSQHYIDGYTIVEMVDWHQNLIAYARLKGEWSLFPGIPLRQAIARAQREKAREEYESRMWDAAVYGGDYYDRPVVRRAPRPRTTRGSRTTTRTSADSSRFNAR